VNTRRRIIAGCAICAFTLSAGALAGWWPFSRDDEESQAKPEPVTTINWEDFIPADFVQPEDPFATMSQEDIDKLLDGSDESEAKLKKLQDEYSYAPVVDELDGKRIKFPAYITPLEFDAQSKISEFLLVPYLGACMHTPPPPANQVVHANSPVAIELKNPYDPVWAVGVVSTETVKSDLAESGYRLKVEKLLPYSE